ncbi:hypothetical protein J7M23_02340 [Candidatus Sumerlaeota bacterium]|nr:hypothetical protein [Candidatus Sumerlaeota bacterium]
MRGIAFFISPHGYGHSARASAVMEALHSISPSIRVEIFTTVPEWFFQESLSRDFGYHSLLTDIGLVQTTPLVEDLPATVERLNEFLPFQSSELRRIARTINELGCKLIVCDISPLGIAVAKEAGIPSVLVENFTWDWIYQGYAQEEPRLREFIPYLKEQFDRADYRIQTEPVCQPRAGNLTTPPVSRKPRSALADVRKKLKIPASAKMVLINLGGLALQWEFLTELKSQRDDIYFVLSGYAPMKQTLREDNVILLPPHSDFYHPDLVQASDAVIAKLGYSTLAEVYTAGVPYGYIKREKFPETEVLTNFITAQMKGIAIEKEGLQDGRWLSQLRDLLSLPRVPREVSTSGAEQVARFIWSLLENQNH